MSYGYLIPYLDFSDTPNEHVPVTVRDSVFLEVDFCYPPADLNCLN